MSKINPLTRITEDSLRLIQPNILNSPPHWSWVPNLIDFDLWYVIQGSGTLTADGTPFELEPGMAFLFAPGQQVHATHDRDNPIQNFAVHFDIDTLTPEEKSTFAFHGLKVKDPLFVNSLVRNLVKIYHTPVEAKQRQCKWCLLQLLSLLWNESKEPERLNQDTTIVEIMQAIQTEPGQTWSLHEMSEKASLSRSQFTRRFTHLTDMSPKEYVIQARIQRACHLLTESNLNVGQIADNLGYRDIYFFSRQFKKVMGISPNAYKEGM